MGERGNRLCLAQKHTENTSCILSTAIARPSYALRLSTHGVTGAGGGKRKYPLNPRRVHSPMLASQQTNDERSESRADTPQLAAGSFIFYQIAGMEHCTASAVQKSVSVAREKVKAEMRKYLQP